MFNTIKVNNTDTNYTHSIFDISDYTGNQYENLSSALEDVPEEKQSGGMTIRYVLTDDSKYVQYRLMSPSWSSNIDDWRSETNETLVYQTSNTKYFALRKKGFWWDSDDHIHVSVHEATSYCRLDMIPIKQGDKFYLKCKANYTSGWIVTDENDVVLEKAPTGEYYEGEITVSASNAARLYINLGWTVDVNNDNVVFILDSYVYRQVKSLNEGQQTLNTRITELKSDTGYDLNSLLNVGFCNNSEGSISISQTTSSRFRYVKLRVSQGDFLYLKAIFLEGNNIIFVTDENNVILGSAEYKEAKYEDIFKVTDANAYWLYINFKYASVGDCYIIKGNSLVDASLSNLKQRNDQIGYLTSCKKLFSIANGCAWNAVNDYAVVGQNGAFSCLGPIPVKLGDKFYLKTNHGSRWAYIITDENRHILEKNMSPSSPYIYEAEITVNNADAAYLFVNSGTSSLDNLILIFDSYVYQKIRAYEDQLSKIDLNKLKVVGYQTSNIKEFDIAYTGAFWWEEDEHVTTHGGGSYCCLTPIPVKKGDKFYLKCYAGYTNAWIVTDVNNAVLSKAASAEDFAGTEVTIEDDNAALLYINCGYISRLNEMVFIFDSYVYQNIKSLNNRVGVLEADNTNVRRLFPKVSYHNLLKEKCPNFYEHMKKKDKDVCVVLTGTSMTQGNRYTTEKEDASERPPLLGTNDLASAIYDKLSSSWYGQKYRRYDHEDITYSEGNWETTNDLVVNNVHIWDDRLQFKNPWTKTTVDANAYVQFTIPSDAWQFNFIYKTDTTGGTCTVAIAESNGKVEVWNGTAWVEANGYTFSMHEDEATYSHDSGLNTRGNTTYQKRLKMRCKNNTTGGINSIGETKVITISKGNDSSRLNVVGFEWSPREFMFTLINGARGSHQWGKEYFNQTPPDLDLTNLEAWQDNDIWEFNPDLIISEVTCINWGASNNFTAGMRKRQFEFYARRAFFNEAVEINEQGIETVIDDQRSLYVKSNGYTNCEIVFFGSLIMGNDNSMYEEDGSFKFINTTVNSKGNGAMIRNNIVGDSSGDCKTSIDNFDWVDKYMKSKTNHIFISTLHEFIKVTELYYGSYKAGFAASGADGNTLSYEGTHLNDNGAALWAALITPLFEF